MSVAARDDGRGAPSGDVGESLSSTAAPPGESKPSIFAPIFVGDGTMPSLVALNTRSSSSSSVSSRSAVSSDEWKPSMRFVGGGGVFPPVLAGIEGDGLGRRGSSCGPGVLTAGRFTGGAAGGRGSMRLNIVSITVELVAGSRGCRGCVFGVRFKDPAPLAKIRGEVFPIPSNEQLGNRAGVPEIPWSQSAVTEVARVAGVEAERCGIR
mmetsp:Transcript_3017/g.11230  ORF Transcript_3017/g.11230 Transcript_3017/m.11230 type:complete len:209 (+) Transcript_3017:2509-3135(+)